MKNQTEVRKFLKQHAADKAELAKLNKKSSVGANHGFRLAAVNSTAAELLSLKVGEDAAIRRGLIFSGKLPGHKNGTTLLPRYRRMLDKEAARVAAVNSHRPV
jgi:anti-sigma factor RsiW